jgi:hypothetical protein
LMTLCSKTIRLVFREKYVSIHTLRNRSRFSFNLRSS